MKFLIVIVCVLCFSQCSHNNSSEIREVDINVDDCETCPVDSFDYDVLPLEDTSKGIVSSIGRMVVTDKGYYISDSRGTPVLYLFAKDGKFLRLIDKHGRSQKEYARIFNFTANERGDTIAILDNMGGEVKLYDQYGHFLLRHVFDDEYSWDDCAIIDNHFYMVSYHGGNKGIVTKYSSDFTGKEVIGEVSRPLVSGAGVSDTKYIQYNSSLICYMDYFNSSFFLIDRKTNDIIKKYTLSSSNMLTSEYVTEKIFGYDQILSFTLADECLYLELQVKDKAAAFKLDLTDDKLYKLDTFVGFCDYKGGSFYSSINAEYVKINIDTDRYLHRNVNRLKAFSVYEDKLKGQENPFVVINKVVE